MAGEKRTGGVSQDLMANTAPLESCKLTSAGAATIWSLGAFSPASNATLDFWFGFSSGVAAVAYQGRCLVYARVYKGGNNLLRATMLDDQRYRRRNDYGGAFTATGQVPIDTMAQPARAWASDPGNASSSPPAALGAPGAGSGSGLRSSEMGLLRAFQSRSALCPIGSVAFTFVREPLSHFIAGFGEACSRGPCGRASRGGEVMVADAELVLQQLFEGRLSKGGLVAAHMSLMGGVARAYALSFVGRLEHATADWERLQQVAGVSLQALDVHVPNERHATSSDPQLARRRMAQLLLQKQGLRKRLCTLLEPDYKCFGHLGYDVSQCYSGKALSPFLDPKSRQESL